MPTYQSRNAGPHCDNCGHLLSLHTPPALTCPVKPTRQELYQEAKKVSSAFVQLIPEMYASWVAEHRSDCTELPDKDDFINWLGNHDWIVATKGT